MSANAQSYSFQAEVSQVLDLVINSLYSNKEVFLRELVSNASDALDKLRFRALTDTGLMADGAELEIRISGDPKAGTLTIEDTGVGMTRDELVQHLGTIAHSGTKNFLQTMKAAGKADANLIGQFGVGFYSAYLVADRVTVTSRAAGGTQSFTWESDGRSSFSVTEGTRTNRGTEVVLHLKEEQKHFADPWQLRELIRRYSDFVGYPIRMKGETESGEEASWETANRASALWQRPRQEITEEQHAEFFKHLTHDGEGPLAHSHFTVEGNQVFTALLYIPKKAPVFEFETEKSGVRLFVKRVFIMDDCRELLPKWMRFVRGVVDSDDLPLNVSRELLQDSTIVRTIKKQVVKKVLDLLDEMAKDRPEDYAQFFKSFGVCIKEGLATEWEHRDRLAKLVRYASSKGEGVVSLEAYVARMPLRQEAIYYVLGESEDALTGSPHLEALKSRGFEVLLMTDPIDEWVTDSLREFDKKPLVSAMRAGLKLEDDEEAKKKREAQSEALSPLTAKVAEVLQGKVADVRLSDRLTESPCCLVVKEGEHHAFFQQVLRSHGRSVSDAARTLELNGSHPLIVSLQAMVEKNGSDPKLSEWIELLYDQALLTEGSRVADPNRFAKSLTSLMQQAAAARTANP